MKKFLKISLPVLALFFISQISSVIYSQGISLVSDSLYSNILKEERTIKVFLPPTYKPESNEKYEVIFVTDGEWAMDPFTFVYKWAQDESYVPPAVIVAIPNKYIDKKNQRDRDFLPVHVPEPAISGGADNFLSFIKTELIPYVETKYPSNKTYSIYGHSYGGLFSLYALLKEPELFNTYYATDPPYGWNNDYLIKMAGEKLQSLSTQKVLWLAGITETYKYQRIDRLDSALQAKASKNLQWKMVTFPNEKHNSVRLKAMYDGIKYVYSGFSNEKLSFHPMNGILLKDKPVRIYLGSGFPDLRYTADGTEPDRTSPKVEQGNFTITGPAQLVLKSFSTNGKYDKTAKGNFELGEAPPSISKPEKINSGGLKYSYYEGNFETLPDFSQLKSSQTGILDKEFNPGKLPKKSNFACLMEGYFEIVKDGYYQFGLISNDGSRFSIGNKLIIDNDGVHTGSSVKSFILPLQKGFYPVRVECFQKNENNTFRLLYLDEKTQNAAPFPFELQYYGN